MNIEKINLIPYQIGGYTLEGCDYDLFWEKGKNIRYYQHKFDAYKNNKKKIFTYNKGFVFIEEPYKTVEKNGVSYGFKRGKAKEVNEETLEKYFKEITIDEFFEKQITHVPTT